MKYFILIIIAGLLTLSLSCNSGSSETKSSLKMEDVFSELNNDLKNKPVEENSANVTLKQGEVTEVLNTERYTYLNLQQEDGDSYWIAISKQNVQKGDKIVFEEGILKHNFESKEFNRMFETIYLVSRFQLLRKNSSNQNRTLTAKENKVSSKSEKKTLEKGEAKALPAGSTPIASIFENPGDFQDKTVTVHGLVVKVNYNIMGKNWVHIQNDENKGQDFTLTTNDQVMEGEEATFTGTIHLDKDFGAGYRYAVIMENARRK
jgi:hypothetical protein